MRKRSAPLWTQRFGRDALDWDQIDTWPLHEISRRVVGPVHRWHVQETGTGPMVLLLHGAGGATHSFRDLIPRLADRFRIVALDLPGHGFTQLGARQRSGLSAMSEDIQLLCTQEGWTPQTIIGHSAGGAVALQMGQQTGAHVIGLNAALGEFPGLAGLVFPLVAKMLAAVPFVSGFFTRTATSPEQVRALIQSTGSTLSPEGYALYRRLVADRAHVDGTLQMMAQWDLQPLLAALPTYTGKVDLIIGTQDQTVPPEVSERATRRLSDARLHQLQGLGHLAHEETPQDVAALLTDLMQS